MDYHIHSKFSFDSIEELDPICRQAIQAGLSEIALTEHLDLHTGQDISDCHYLRHETRREAAVEEMRQKYRSRLIIRYGLELGQPHRDPAFMDTLRKTRRFDFVLGSVHYTTDERELLTLTYPDRSFADRIISDYFDNLSLLPNQPDVDALAHICLPLRVLEHIFPEPSFLCYTDRLRPILQRLIQAGKALEVSTKGLRYWLHAIEPEFALLRLYRELGGELITVGSDSHDASTVGEGIRDAYAYIARAGFRYVTRYEAHQPRPVRLEN